MKLKAKCLEVLLSNGEEGRVPASDDILKVANNSDAIIEMIYDATGSDRVRFSKSSIYVNLGDIDEEEAEEAAENFRALTTSEDFRTLVKEETQLVLDEDDDPDVSDEELMTLKSSSSRSYLMISSRVTILE